jgi:hypothetical protein
MKNNKLNIIAVLALFIGLASCVEDGDFSLPNTVETEPAIAQYAKSPFSTVQDNLKQEFNNNNQLEYTFPTPDSDDPNAAPLAVIEGYVVSSDAAGNFYKKLVLQDAPENPTQGFELLLDNTSLSQSFEQGRKVYVILDGLTVTYDDGESTSNISPNNNVPGKYTVGQLIGDRVDEVVQPRVEKHVFASTTKVDIVPTVIKIDDITEANVNTFVKIEGAQFEGDELANSFSGEPDDSFDGLRTFSECESGSSIELQTSTFASFKSNQVPQGRGSVNFVLSKDFRAEFFVAIINTPVDIMFDGQRCDPVFGEDFSSAIDNTDLDIEGWINYAESGSQVWTEQVFSGNGYAEFNPFRSGDVSNVAWLITPEIDLDAQDGEYLTFQTEHAYPDSGHEPLDVLISTDFDGTEAGVATATWTSLSFDVSYLVDFGQWYTFTNSGAIDLSNYTGTAYIAFRYTGSDTMNQNMTLHIDNVKILVP